MQRFVFILISIISGGLGGLAWFKLNRNPKIIFSFFVGLVIAFGVFWGLQGLQFNSAKPVHIYIDTPLQATVQGTQAQIQGTVSPKNSRIYVLVHPIHTNKWWVQAVPSISDDATESATWTSIIYLGAENAGQGEYFEVIALASADSLIADILSGRFLSIGEVVETFPMLSRSNTIEFFRQK
jgi:hypothetical protein